MRASCQPKVASRGSYVIYGGTGRFAHAVGTGVLGGFEAIDLTTGVGNGQITLRGVLAY